MKKTLTVSFLFLLCFDSYSQLSQPNPEFLNYLENIRTGKISSVSDDGHFLGVIPSLKKLYPAPNTCLPLFPLLPLPSVYDLRLLGKVTPVKNQGNCGSCWAFATYGSIESRWKVIGFPDFDLSENNLKDCHGFDYQPCAGGQSWMSISYMNRRSGPVLESEDPYVAGNAACTTGITPTAFEMNGWLLPKDITIIKQAVIEYGAVYTAFYWGGSYYNPVNYTYYYNGNNSQNHGVVIVGWNDTLNTAGGQGAWIIKNSWGDSWGDNGYFYLSYNDSQANNEVCLYPTRHTLNPSSQLYYYDELGEVLDCGFGNTIGYGLVKYTASGNYPVTRVSTWIAYGNSTTDIEIWDSFNGTTLSNLLSSINGIFTPYYGYYTFDLPAPLNLSSGNDFYIRVKYSTPGYTYPIPVEYALSGYSSNAVIESGVCWISSNGTTWIPAGDTTSNNFDLCIRAYSANESPAPVTTAGSVIACTGNEISVPLTVTGFTDITCLKLRLDYDASLMSYSSCCNINSVCTGITISDVVVNGNSHCIIINWDGTSAQSISNGGKLLDLNFNFIEGTPDLNFNNTSQYGRECEYGDAQRSPLFDNPSSTYYINSHITQPVSTAHTWTGSGNYEWTNPQNWNPQTVPGCNDDVSIPGGITRMPVISTNGLSCRNILISSDATLHVNTGITITVRGKLQIAGQ